MPSNNNPLNPVGSQNGVKTEGSQNNHQSQKVNENQSDLEGKKEGNNQSYILVPRGWNRIIEKGTITYISPNKSRLTCMDDLKQYLLMEGTCKCGLICPLIPSECFNFDTTMPSRFNGSGMKSELLPQQQECCIGNAFEKAFPPAPPATVELTSKQKAKARSEKEAARRKQKAAANNMLKNANKIKANLDAANALSSQSHILAEDQALKASSSCIAGYPKNQIGSAVPPNINSSIDIAKYKVLQGNSHVSTTVTKSHAMVPSTSNAVRYSLSSNVATYSSAASPSILSGSLHRKDCSPPPNVTVEPSQSSNLHEALQADRKRKLLESQVENGRKIQMMQQSKEVTSSSTILPKDRLKASKPDVQRVISSFGMQSDGRDNKTINPDSVDVVRHQACVNSALPVSINGSHNIVRRSLPDTVCTLAPKGPTNTLVTANSGTKSQLSIQPKFNETFPPQLAVTGKNAFYTAPVGNNVTQYVIFGGSGASQALQSLALHSTSNVNTAASLTDSTSGLNTNRFIQPFTTQVNYVSSSSVNLHTSAVLNPAFQVAAPTVMHYVTRNKVPETNNLATNLQTNTSTQNCLVSNAASGVATNNKNYVRIAPAAQDDRQMISVNAYGITPWARPDVLALDNRNLPLHVAQRTSNVQHKRSHKDSKSTSAKAKSQKVSDASSPTSGVKNLKPENGPTCTIKNNQVSDNSTANDQFSVGDLVCGPYDGIKQWPGRITAKSCAATTAELTVSWLSTSRTSIPAQCQLSKLNDCILLMKESLQSENRPYAKACELALELVNSSNASTTVLSPNADETLKNIAQSPTDVLQSNEDRSEVNDDTTQSQTESRLAPNTTNEDNSKEIHEKGDTLPLNSKASSPQDRSQSSPTHKASETQDETNNTKKKNTRPPPLPRR